MRRQKVMENEMNDTKKSDLSVLPKSRRGGLCPFTVLLLVIFMLLVGGVFHAVEPVAGSPQGEGENTVFYFPVIRKSVSLLPEASGPLYGVNFISSAEALADEQQYQNGLATGATWNRWPIYWPNVERNPNELDWSTQDATVQADIVHGLRINAILLATPGFYTTSLARPTTAADLAQRPSTLALYRAERATPVGLYDPIFGDGSDVPGPNKVINEGNVWARFVYTAVNRYKPGGVLAQANDWPLDAGITHWEMWNEPDLTIFWDGSLPDYARLLKVGYLAAKQADPEAQILFGALANNASWLTFYEEVLEIYDGDSLAAANGYFHDILATHSYFYAWQSWLHVWRASRTMADYGLDKPIWFNENGVPAWDDYPGPVWDPQSSLRATMSEQADYIIQSGFYAIFAGADAIFHFQLYDGCGNQPQGTDFPPHNGELCDADGNISGTGLPCAGDANGLFRNPPDAACFRQHPQPETPRPNLAAFQVLTQYVTDVAPLWRARVGHDNPALAPQEWIALYRPQTKQRLVAMWARFGEPQTAVVPAASSSGDGLLVAADGSTQAVKAVDGQYTIQLPGATNQNAFWDPSLYPIGGRPYILIETNVLPSDTIDTTQLNTPVHLDWDSAIEPNFSETGYNLKWSPKPVP